MGKNLLIIDDEIHLLGVMEFILSRETAHIFTAHTSREGISILETNEIHCVLCDMSLPRMTGLEIMRTVREKGIMAPFVFYTADETPEAMKEASELGAIDFILKPQIQGVVEAVRAGLNNLPYNPSRESPYGRFLSQK